jgi:hypothetical protein
LLLILHIIIRSMKNNDNKSKILYIHLFYPFSYFFRNFLQYSLKLPKLDRLNICVEQWEKVFLSRRFYSIISVVFIYLLPISSVAVAYYKICTKLRHRLKSRLANTPSEAKRIVSTSTNILNLLYRYYKYILYMCLRLELDILMHSAGQFEDEKLKITYLY